MYRFKLQSHPDRLLKDHIHGVRRFALQLFERASLNIRSEEMEKLKIVLKRLAVYTISERQQFGSNII